jgi:hypothetical protein
VRLKGLIARTPTTNDIFSDRELIGYPERQLHLHPSATSRRTSLAL